MNSAADHFGLSSAQEPAADSTQEGSSSVAAHPTVASDPRAVYPKRRERLQYFAAFRFLFDSPAWPQTLALSSICTFIPVFGQVALLGYYYEIIERLHRDPQSGCPTFDFRRFSIYATRCVWAYLLILAITSVLQVTLQVPLQYTLMGVIFAFQSSETTGAIVAAIAAAFWLGVLFLVLLMMAFVVQPLMLRGGMSQELRFMFRMRWVIGYSKRVWLEILFVQALLFAAMCLLFPIGLMLFCIGVIPMSIIIGIAGSHLTWQVYELALSRGCGPIPLRPAEADEPPVAWSAPVAVGKGGDAKLH